MNGKIFKMQVRAKETDTRYLLFLKKFPSLANLVPLFYIASYLGITQQSFSRIRRNIPSIAFYQMVNGLLFFK
jgi:ABC-type maltose transport system permease subunit